MITQLKNSERLEEALSRKREKEDALKQITQWTLEKDEHKEQIRISKQKSEKRKREKEVARANKKSVPVKGAQGVEAEEVGGQEKGNPQGGAGPPGGGRAVN